MSAVLTRRRPRRGPDAYRQSSLFGQVVAPPRPEVRPREGERDARPAQRDHELERDVQVDAPETRALAGPTLDAAVSSLWRSLAVGEPCACPLCGSAMEPRHSAGAGVVGGRCTSCATTLA
jgi:hypothetical protein